MQWSKPDFQEITLNMEVTAYVNTEGAVRKPQEAAPQAEANSAGRQDNVQGRVRQN